MNKLFLSVTTSNLRAAATTYHHVPSEMIHIQHQYTNCNKKQKTKNKNKNKKLYNQKSVFLKSF